MHLSSPTSTGSEPFNILRNKSDLMNKSRPSTEPFTYSSSSYNQNITNRSYRFKNLPVWSRDFPDHATTLHSSKSPLHHVIHPLLSTLHIVNITNLNLGVFFGALLRCVGKSRVRVYVLFSEGKTGAWWMGWWIVITCEREEITEKKKKKKKFWKVLKKSESIWKVGNHICEVQRIVYSFFYLYIPPPCRFRSCYLCCSRLTAIIAQIPDLQKYPQKKKKKKESEIISGNSHQLQKKKKWQQNLRHPVCMCQSSVWPLFPWPPFSSNDLTDLKQISLYSG